MTSSPRVKDSEATPNNSVQNNHGSNQGRPPRPTEAEPLTYSSHGATEPVELNPVRGNQDTEINMDDRDDVDEYSQLHHSQERSFERFPAEPLKALLTFFWSCCCLTITGFMTTLAHDRYPVNETALPDVVLDNVEEQHWAFKASEYCFMGLFVFWFVMVFLHHHKWVLLRRQFFITGLLYLFRSITMIVTSLPVANPSFTCAPKTDGTFVAVMLRSIKYILGMGLSTAGVLHTCGDWVYSGHTSMLLMAYLLINEYFPKRFWPFKWFALFISLMGIAFILLAKDHYTLDCVVAYYITTRIFWTYHAIAAAGKKSDENANLVTTLCYSDFVPRSSARIPTLRRSDPDNPNNRVIWFWPVAWLEANVDGVVPKEFRWPLPFPRKWTHWSHEMD